MNAASRNRALALVVFGLVALNGKEVRATETDEHCAAGDHTLCITAGGSNFCPSNPFSACWAAYNETWNCNALISNYGQCVVGSGACEYTVYCRLYYGGGE